MPISRQDAYLMGMFSTLNYLIDAPLSEILSQIPMVPEVQEALLHQTGRCGQLYLLTISYERADWAKIDALATELGVPTNLLTSIYFNCMEEVNQTWQEIMEPGARTQQMEQAEEDRERPAE